MDHKLAYTKLMCLIQSSESFHVYDFGFRLGAYRLNKLYAFTELIVLFFAPPFVRVGVQ